MSRWKGRAIINGEYEQDDDFEREYDATKYLWKCADGVWRDHSARITHAMNRIEMAEDYEEFPYVWWGNSAYVGATS